MGAGKTKLVFLLVVYFAGFTTGVYCSVPVFQDAQSCEKGFVYSALKSDEFAQSFNGAVHKCVDFAKDAAWRAGRFIKQKFDEEPISDSE